MWNYEGAESLSQTAFAALPGLGSKVWLADSVNGVYGGVYTFESANVKAQTRSIHFWGPNSLLKLGQ